MTAAVPLSPAPAPARWIISPRADLVWFIGSAAAGYAFLALNLILAVPVSYLWWFWSVGFDGTHIFATASRTYFETEARRGQRRLLFGSLAFFFLLGPAMVLAGWTPLLALIVATWAYYHVMRQHYGLMVLYQVKNRDLDRADCRLDRAFLGIMLVAPPFHRFFVHHPYELGMPRGWALASAAPWVEPLMWGTVVAIPALWLWRQAARWRAGLPLNWPKLLLLAAIAPLHWLTFAFMSWKAAVPTVTIVHNLQYHALVWFHNRNRYGADRARHGRIAAAGIAAYLAAALVFSALYRVPGFYLGRASELAFGFFCGFGLTHYYLDSKIWRVRTDPGLRDALRLR